MTAPISPARPRRACEVYALTCHGCRTAVEIVASTPVFTCPKCGVQLGIEWRPATN